MYYEDYSYWAVPLNTKRYSYIKRAVRFQSKHVDTKPIKGRVRMDMKAMHPT